LEELLKQISTKEKTMEQMSQELDAKTKELKEAQRHRDEKDAAFSKKIQMLEIQHSEMKHSLQKEQVDKENMKKHISQLEGEVKKKEAELNAMEKKLKNNKGRGAAMTSRDNEAAKENAKKSKSEMHKVIAQVCHTYYQISRTYLLHIRTG
jgi:chromosome segregation ATPase